MIVTIKLNNLGFPSLIVYFSIANFDSFSTPSRNFIIDFPSFSKVRLFKTSIYNNILAFSYFNKCHIINSKSISILFSSPLKFENIFSRYNNYLYRFKVNIVIYRDNMSSFYSIPVNISFTRFKSNIFSACVFE